MLKVINKVVDKWKDCKFEPRMYDEILTAVEKEGMMPPFNNDYFVKHWRTAVNGYVWDKE